MPSSRANRTSASLASEHPELNIADSSTRPATRSSRAPTPPRRSPLRFAPAVLLALAWLALLLLSLPSTSTFLLSPLSTLLLSASLVAVVLPLVLRRPR